MEWIEVTARTLEQARERALDLLGVHEGELEVEVLAEPRSGFLGMGRTDARIRARVKPVSREKPGERRRRRRRKRRSSSGSQGRTAQDRPAGASPGGAREVDDRAAAHDATTTPASSPTTKETTVSELSLSQQRDVAVQFLEGLVKAFDLEAGVHGTVIDEDTVEVVVEGTGLGVLIGPGGATIRALEELARAVVQRSTGGQAARIRVDVGGYRDKRREALVEFARQVGGEVRETGVEQVLEPMAPPDRKVVHDVIAEMEGVETTSEGDEPMRRVVIRPA